MALTPTLLPPENPDVLACFSSFPSRISPTLDQLQAGVRKRPVRPMAMN